MSTIRLYFDVDSMEHALIAGLRARGVDVLTAFEAGTTACTDSEQIAFAHAQSRVLFSFNASDFCRIHGRLLAEGNAHSGMILAPQQRYSVGRRVRLLLNILAAKTAEDMQSHIEFLTNWEPGAGR